MIIDAHAHIFPRVQGRISTGTTLGLGYGRIAAGDTVTQLLPPYNERTLFTPEMLVANLDWAGVDKAILLQGPFYGECNTYVLDALKRYPDRLSGLAYLDPWDSTAHDMLAWVLEAGLFCGVKLECSEATGLVGIHPGARLDAPENEWLWKTLEHQNLTLVLDLGKPGSASYQTGAVHSLAAGYPRLKIVIAHLGQPGPEYEASPRWWQDWQEQIDLGKLPNVWFDCAALPAYLPDETFPYPTAGKYLRLAIARIGAHKVMWGTDQPGLLAVLDLPQLVKMMALHLAFLPPHEQALVGGENAAQVFNPAKLVEKK